MNETKNDREASGSKAAFERKQPELTALEIIELGKKVEAPEREAPEDDQADSR